MVDSLLLALRTHPAVLFRLAVRLVHGKAAFKALLSSSVTLDVTHLPYNRTLLHFLKQEHERGRAIYLATGADYAVAKSVADHVGIFAGVLSSDGRTNLTGARKLDSLRSQLGSDAFDYVGNDTPDLPLLITASEAMVANPSLGLRMRLRAHRIRLTREFNERSHSLQSLVKAARIHQWAKNLLIFLPLLLAHGVTVRRFLTASARLHMLFTYGIRHLHH